MTDLILTELAMKCRALLDANPVLRKAGALDAAILRYDAKRRAAFSACLTALAAAIPGDDRLSRLQRALDKAFPGLVDELTIGLQPLPAAQPPRPVRADPYRSAALSMWMDGLNRALDWIRRGADLSILDFALAPELLAQDLRAEQSPARILACGIGLVPAVRLAGSRIMAKRLGQCLPGLPGPEYPDLDDVLLDSILRHLDRAISLVRKIDPAGFVQLTACLHTFHVGVRHDPLCSFSSSNELPGSSVVVLSLQRLEEGDIGATAAQLLHEVGHVMLGLHVMSAATPLPTDAEYVSPYKNDLQSLESILHMAYTIPWECAVRVALLGRLTAPAKRAREVAFVIAYAARQMLLIDIARAGLKRHSDIVARHLPDVAAIPDWSAAILAMTDRLLATESAPRQAAHLSERNAMAARQAWDIGQMLLRGKVPVDPRIGSVTIAPDGSGLTLEYDGTTHEVVLDAYRATGKNYGAYADAVEPAQEVQR